MEVNGFIIEPQNGEAGANEISISVPAVNEGIDKVVEVDAVCGDHSDRLTLVHEGLRQRFITADGKVFCVLGGGRFAVLKDGGAEPPTPVETYTRLTYIEATGKQYINTGYVVQEDDVIEMYYISTSNTSQDKALYGCYDDNGRLWFSLYSNTGYARFGSTESESITNARMRYMLTMRKSETTVDGGASATTDFAGMPHVPVYLFARNNKDAGVGMYGYCRCLGFSISNGAGDVIINMKPCKRDSDGAVGMLDLVSGRFFENGGEGDGLIAGAEINIPDGYEVIDYVTFKKDKLYNIGIIDSTQKIEVMFARNEVSTTPYLYGCVTNPHTASVTAYLSSGGAWRFGSSYKSLYTNDTLMHNVSISNGQTNADFTSGTFTKSTFTTPDTVVLGGYRAASGALTKNYQGKVFYFRISEGDDYIIDWHPCKRLSDGVEGFWDCVSQTFIEPMS